MNRLLKTSSLLGVTLALLSGSGCKTTTEKTEFEDRVLAEEASLAEMRYEVTDFTDEFTRTVEYAADRIETLTTDPEVRQRTLLWKMNAIPEALLCLDHPSPVAGLLDLWALAIQQDNYYRQGLGRDAFGDHQSVALESTAELVQSIEEILRVFSRPEKFPTMQEEVAKFAREHPFHSDLFDSPSIRRSLPQQFVPSSQNVFSSMNSLETEVHELQAKLGIYMEHLPRQSRWQAQRLVTDLINLYVSPQLTNAYDQLAGERQLVLENINRQREETLETVHAERVAVLNAVHEERKLMEQGLEHLVTNTLVAVEAMIDRERASTLEAINEQRTETLNILAVDLEQVANDAMDRAHAKLWLTLAVIWVGLVGLLVVARFLFKPTPANTPGS